MAEAHSAVAFSFSITHDGYNFDYNREVLNLVWDSGVRSWKKRLARFRVSFLVFKKYLIKLKFLLFSFKYIECCSQWRISSSFTKLMDCYINSGYITLVWL